jgi:outer membrane protein assembly factor BamB
MGPSSPVSFAIAVDATSDSQPVDPLWTAARAGCTHSSPLIIGSTLYRYGSSFGLQHMINGVPDKRKNVPVDDTSALYCIDARTGALTATIPLPGVSNFTSPVATADGHLYLATGGRSYVIRAGPKPEIVGTNELDDYNVGPSPALVDGKLIIRGAGKLWCIGKP